MEKAILHFPIRLASLFIMFMLQNYRICLIAMVLLVLASGRLRSANPPITALEFSPNGDRLLAVSQRGITVYEWPGLEQIQTIPASMANVHTVSFSPDGQRFAVAGGNPAEIGSVEIYSWPGSQSLARFGDHVDSVRSLVWLDDTSLLSASIDRDIKLWKVDEEAMSEGSTARWACALTLSGHSRSVDALCLLQDSPMLISAGVDQSLRVWDLDKGKLVRNLNQHTQPIQALAIRPADGGLPMVASAAADRTIRFWQPTIGRMVRYVRLDSEPLDIAWLTNGENIAASCVDGRVRIVEADTVQLLRTIPAIEGWVYSIAVHPQDSSLAAAGVGGQICRLPIPDGL